MASPTPRRTLNFDDSAASVQKSDKKRSRSPDMDTENVLADLRPEPTSAEKNKTPSPTASVGGPSQPLSPPPSTNTKRRRKRILELRTTEAEKALAEGEAAWAEKEKALNRLVEFWKDEVRKVRGKITTKDFASQADFGIVTNPPSSATAVATDGAGAGAGAGASSGPSDAIVDMYKTLTGISVAPVDGTVGKFVVSADAADGGTTKFSLGPTTDDANPDGGAAEELEFVPLERPDLLPEYLRGSLAFDKAMAPVFLGQVIGALNPGASDDDDDDDNDDDDDDVADDEIEAQNGGGAEAATADV